MRICKKCGQSKQAAEFEPHRHNCRVCRGKRKKQFQTRSGPGLRAKLLKRHYNMTPEQYDAIFASQGGVCKICGDPPGQPWNRLAVDHCHKSGRVRGLLCAKCNKGLGQFNDDPKLLKSAITYLSI